MKKYLFFFLVACILQSCEYKYRDNLEFICVYSYSNGSEKGTIYRLNDRAYDQKRCYTSTGAPNFILVGEYEEMFFGYDEDSTVVLFGKNNCLKAWYNLRGEKLRCNYYTNVLQEEYNKIYAKNPNIWYFPKEKIAYDRSKHDPKLITYVELEAMNKGDSTLPKRGDVYVSSVQGIDESVLNAFGYTKKRYRTEDMLWLVLASIFLGCMTVYSFDIDQNKELIAVGCAVFYIIVLYILLF